MSNLYLCTYNNYFNRINKTAYNSAQTPVDYSTYIVKTVANVNFNYNDGVNTTQVINYGGNVTSDSVINDTLGCDYLIVENAHYGLTRWFITENEWNRRGQQILTLRRDLITDFWDSFQSMPMFIEKGTPATPTVANGFEVFNNENMTFNQVLQDTVDITQSGNSTQWIVGYLAQNATDTISFPAVEASYNSLQQFPLWQYVKQIGSTVYTNPLPILDEYSDFGVRFNPIVLLEGQTIAQSSSVYAGIGNIVQGTTATTSASCQAAKVNANEMDLNGTTFVYYDNGAAISTLTEANQIIASAVSAVGATINKFPELINRTDFKVTNFRDYVGRYYRIGSTVYQVRAQQYTSGGNPVRVDMSWTDGGQLAHQLWTETTTDPNNTYSGVNKLTGAASTPFVDAKYYYLFLDTVSSYGTWDTLTNRNHANNHYDIFAMADSSAARAIAAGISAHYYGSGALFDIQLLPYKPDLTGVTGTTVGGVTIYWLKTDSFNFTFSYTKSYANILAYKQGALCETWRLCSPNHSTAWDFNPAINLGVTQFKVECTYKPFSPYIHVIPTFGGLYGANYTDDPRGLVCGGDFSLPVVSDAWQTYQVNNKAYKESFDREIQNLQTTQDIQRKLELWQMHAGMLQGAATGAGAGLLSGSTAAGVAGGVAGGVISGIGGMLDLKYNDLLRHEALDFKKDMFGYQLQNIQMQPQVLGRTSAFDINCHNCVYIEIYNASNLERNALASKLKYDGFSIGRIATFGEYANRANATYSNYIKGSLIRNTSINEDTHIFNELANELYKGVYLE